MEKSFQFNRYLLSLRYCFNVKVYSPDLNICEYATVMAVRTTAPYLLDEEYNEMNCVTIGAINGLFGRVCLGNFFFKNFNCNCNDGIFFRFKNIKCCL